MPEGRLLQVNRVRFQNVRCFEDLTAELHPEVTLCPPPHRVILKPPRPTTGSTVTTTEGTHPRASVLRSLLARVETVDGMGRFLEHSAAMAYPIRKKLASARASMPG